MLAKEIGFYGDYSNILDAVITQYDEKMNNEKNKID